MVTLAERNDSNPALPHPAGAPDDLTQPDVEIAFHAETSMDRDASTNPMARHLTAKGEDCLSDERLAIAQWGTDEPAALQLTRAREHLTGEFDRPDPLAVRALARLYLHLGMGAEARQTLRAFDDESGEAALLTSLARIIDDQEPIQADPLARMQECDTAAALWAFLARPVDAAAPVNAAAVLRAFSGLPAALRKSLGQRLSDRFIHAANPGAAHDIRNAMSRSVGAAEDRSLGMVDANLALDANETAPALKKLDQLAQGNDVMAVEAAMTALRLRLDQDETIDPKQVEAIAALAFEHGDGALGAALAALEIEARAAAADYSGAARRLEERQAQYPDTDPATPCPQGFCATCRSGGRCRLPSVVLSSTGHLRRCAGRSGSRVRRDFADRRTACPTWLFLRGARTFDRACRRDRPRESHSCPPLTG